MINQCKALMAELSEAEIGSRLKITFEDGSNVVYTKVRPDLWKANTYEYNPMELTQVVLSDPRTSYMLINNAIKPDESSKCLPNVQIHDNGSAYLVRVNGLTTSHHSSLGAAWDHIVWMYRVASQQFTVGEKETPVAKWIEGMKIAGYLE